MKIFLDESGQFKSPENPTTNNNYECVVGVIMNDQLLAKLEELYRDKDKRFLRDNAKEIIELLVADNAKAFVIVYDANLCVKDTIENHKKNYINSISEDRNHPELLLESVNRHIKILTDTSHPQYVKALLAIQLLQNILRGVIGESNQYIEDNLKAFKFVFDEETDRIKSTIKYFVSFAIFCNSVAKPIDIDNKQNIFHLLNHSNGKYLDAQRFFESIDFIQSKNSLGVRIADVISNQVFRIFKGESFSYDRTLLSKLFLSPYSIDFMHFNIDQTFIDNTVHKTVMEWLDAFPSNYKFRDY